MKFRLSVDIGGSLIKASVFVPIGGQSPILAHRFKANYVKDMSFASCVMGEFVDFVVSNGIHKLVDHFTACGGGSLKFESYLSKEFRLPIKKNDEMESLIFGLNFLLRTFPGESFLYLPEKSERKPRFRLPTFRHRRDLFPYLFVSMGSGISFVHVSGESPYSWERVDGSSIGGGTFWGLAFLLTGAKTFDELLDLAKHGNSDNVDLLVGDIYGKAYGKVGLASNTIASCFGKVASALQKKKKVSDADIANSLLKMICLNIAQLACHNAKRLKVKRVVFGGYFIRNHPVAMAAVSFAMKYWSGGHVKTLVVFGGYFIRNHPVAMAAVSFAMKYWSGGHVKTLFVAHEGFLGSTGCVVQDCVSYLSASTNLSMLSLRLKSGAELSEILPLFDPRPVGIRSYRKMMSKVRKKKNSSKSIMSILYIIILGFMHCAHPIVRWLGYFFYLFLFVRRFFKVIVKYTCHKYSARKEPKRSSPGLIHHSAILNLTQSAPTSPSHTPLELDTIVLDEKEHAEKEEVEEEEEEEEEEEKKEGGDRDKQEEEEEDIGRSISIDELDLKSNPFFATPKTSSLHGTSRHPSVCLSALAHQHDAKLSEQIPSGRKRSSSTGLLTSHSRYLANSIGGDPKAVGTREGMKMGIMQLKAFPKSSFALLPTLETYEQVKAVEAESDTDLSEAEFALSPEYSIPFIKIHPLILEQLECRCDYCQRHRKGKLQ
ncbi:Type II pantothenate kinase like protein [Aduncisulcus paluster]|uniref:Type II pantothenate kinase like protein n=1 Tax=Aduncisulcus paluster TaxID=2918883 RepID=A0ABQ5K3Z6_9EUKA|nr:Type II pantothenate kinase like protein [Aduncisulcus paluster]